MDCNCVSQCVRRTLGELTNDIYMAKESEVEPLHQATVCETEVTGDKTANLLSHGKQEARHDGKSRNMFMCCAWDTRKRDDTQVGA